MPKTGKRAAALKRWADLFAIDSEERVSCETVDAMRLLGIEPPKRDATMNPPQLFRERGKPSNLRAFEG